MKILNRLLKLSKKNWSFIVVLLLSAIYMVAFSILSVRRHLAFASNFDLSNMDNTMWNTLHGNFFSLRLADDMVSRFAVHADLILILLSPIYLIFDYARALLVTQSIFLGLGAIPIYFIAMKILKDKIVAIAIVVLYLLNPGLQWANIYDFHGVTLAIPFLLATFYFAISKKWIWFSIFAFLSIITKEQISLIVAILGIILFFVYKEKKIGAITFLISVGWFLAMVFVVMPHFSPAGVHWGFSLFSGNVESGYNPLDTRFNLNGFITSGSFSYYQDLLAPFGYLPLLGFPWLILGTPDLAINILSHPESMRSIRFHYDSGIIPGVIIATIYGLLYLKIILNKLKRLRKYSTLILYCLIALSLLFAVRFNYFYSPLPTTPSCWCFIYNVTDEDRQFKQILNQIPKKAVVTSSLEIRPHVNHRPEVYSVPSATPSADFIALITQNRIIGNYEPKEYENQLIPILLASPDHKVVFQSEHFYLFKRVQ